MKRAMCFLLISCMLLALLPGCQKQSPEELEPAVSALDMVTAIVASTGDRPGIDAQRIDSSDWEQLVRYTEVAYELTEDEWEDCAVLLAGGVRAYEIAVLRCADKEGAICAEERLKSYLKRREGAFTGYAPDQAALVEAGEVCRRGTYVGLFICRDPKAAKKVFTEIQRSGKLPDSLSESTTPTEPEPTMPTGPELERMPDMKVLATSLAVYCWDEIGENGQVLIYRNGQIDSRYGVDANQIRRSVIVQPEKADALAFEMTVFCMVSEAVAEQSVASLQGYLKAREAEFSSKGLSDQARLVSGGVVARSGRYLAVFICRNPEELRSQLDFAIQEGLRFADYDEPVFVEASVGNLGKDRDPDYPNRGRYVPPGREDMSLYDTSAILKAWRTGDPSALTADDRAIYDRAAWLLGELIHDGMSDFDKELVIYGWIINNVDYDWTQLEVLVETPRTSFTPYGGLVEHRAVCLGFATTFELLLTMADIECITVVGASEDSVEDHAWNMVRLNGEWYCADPTWDMGATREWSFFNVTSDYMGKTDHQWDYANTPEATATDHGK